MSSCGRRRRPLLRRQRRRGRRHGLTAGAIDLPPRQLRAAALEARRQQRPVPAAHANRNAEASCNSWTPILLYCQQRRRPSQQRLGCKRRLTHRQSTVITLCPSSFCCRLLILCLPCTEVAGTPSQPCCLPPGGVRIGRDDQIKLNP